MIIGCVEAMSILEAAKKSARVGRSKDCLNYVDRFVDWCIQFNPSGVQEVWWNFVKELAEITVESRTVYKVLSYVDLEVVCMKNELLEEVNTIARILGVGNTTLLKEASVHFYMQKKDWNRREIFSLQVMNSIDIQWFRSLVIGDSESAMIMASTILGDTELINDRSRWLMQSILRLNISEQDACNILRLVYAHTSQVIKESFELKYLQSTSSLKNLSEARQVLNQEIISSNNYIIH